MLSRDPAKRSQQLAAGAVKTGPHGEDAGPLAPQSLRVRIRISSPELIDELLAFLRAEPSAVVEQVSDDEVEVSLLGSYREDAARMELYLRLRAWEATRHAGGVRVEILG